MARGGINKVILVGNLGQDPEMRCMPDGTAVANLRIATSESWRDKSSGEQKELTEWHRVVLYQRLAEIAGKYLCKGAKIYIEGRLRTRKWQDQNGQDRYITEVQVDELQMLDSRSGQAATANQSIPSSNKPQQQYNQTTSDFPEYTAKEGSSAGNEPLVDFDDSIPF